ncbi:ion channel [Nocardioides sp.]|uniref:ion channel n=1 Tax=Nocardioides sp. TaxID=35761 RepID=UPI002735C9FE|nr:ion channel [Nocardioides sp.]MDP3894087.1 ion channel [Nocardioides sp.]
MTILGALLVLAALADIFHTLWHPRGFGTLARLIFAAVWRVSRSYTRSRRSTELAGPIGLLFTGITWATLLVVGFALVYLPHLPDGFHFDPELVGDARTGPVTAVYVSAVALATLGLGDVVPAHPLLRVAVPLQALLGFVLLSALISWVLQLYPALTRRRALARRLSTMAEVGVTGDLGTMEPLSAVQLLEGVRESLSVIEMDLLQYGESYYFREKHADLSFAVALPHLTELIGSAGRSPSREVRVAAAMLEHARNALLGLVAREFLRQDLTLEETMAALLADHQQDA